jgi:polar amino acid transport system substrate-binding protein
MLRVIVLSAATLMACLSGRATAQVTEPAGTLSSDAVRATLAPAGTLRAVFLGTNPVQGRVDPVSGAVTGPVADLVTELARRAALPYELIPVPDTRAVINALQGGTADIGFLAFEASRAEEVDYAGPYALMLSSYVVASTSRHQDSAALDQEGFIIGAVQGVSQALYLGSHVVKAQVRLFPAQPSRMELEKLLGSGDLVAFGMNRQRALDFARQSPALRALDDSFLDIPQEFVVPRGDVRKRLIIERYAREMRGTGFVRSALEKAGLQESTRVIP